jgi:Lar family restriction alleviation protein
VSGIVDGEDIPVQKKDLAPCPFCGSKKVALPDGMECFEKGYIAVRCDDCQAEGPAIFKGKSEDAVKAWNKRSPVILL